MQVPVQDHLEFGSTSVLPLPNMRKAHPKPCLFAGIVAIVLCVVSGSANAAADETETPTQRRMALGLQVDLLPTILSASVGEVGGAGQVWLGIENIRLRYIGAHLFVPESVHGQDGFSPLRTTVFATVLDYTFGPNFDRWWISTGFEIWLNRAEHEGTGVVGEWENVIWTVGGGYIWRFAGNFYLDPWIAVHVPMNNRSRLIGSERFESWPIQPEISLKIGWFHEL